MENEIIEKICSACGFKKKLDDFRKDRRRKSGKSSICTICNNKKSALWKQKYPERHLKNHRRYATRNPESCKDSQLRSKYNISLVQYNEMLVKQDNQCAACKDTFTGLPHIDHDHSCCSGKTSCGSCIRGLLCVTCNNGLGCFKDDINRLLNAISYLEKFKI
jgi:Recombination endonuclease VII